MLNPLQPLIILLAFLAPPAPDDADLFKGSWKVTTLDTPEQKSKSEDLKEVEVVFEGDKYRQTQGVVLEEGTFKLMPDKTPRAIDFAIKSGPDKGKDQLGVYQFECRFGPAAHDTQESEEVTKSLRDFVPAARACSLFFDRADGKSTLPTD
jgi:uncharacterized protein (TIGR03067 family)